MAAAAGGDLITARSHRYFAMFFEYIRNKFIGKQSGQILSLVDRRKLFLPIHVQSSRGGRVDVQNG